MELVVRLLCCASVKTLHAIHQLYYVLATVGDSCYQLFSCTCAQFFRATQYEGAPYTAHDYIQYTMAIAALCGFLRVTATFDPSARRHSAATSSSSISILKQCDTVFNRDIACMLQRLYNVTGRHLHTLIQYSDASCASQDIRNRCAVDSNQQARSHVALHRTALWLQLAVTRVFAECYATLAQPFSNEAMTKHHSCSQLRRLRHVFEGTRHVSSPFKRSKSHVFDVAINGVEVVLCGSMHRIKRCFTVLRIVAQWRQLSSLVLFTRGCASALLAHQQCDIAAGCTPSLATALVMLMCNSIAQPSQRYVLQRCTVRKLTACCSLRLKCCSSIGCSRQFSAKQRLALCYYTKRIAVAAAVVAASCRRLMTSCTTHCKVPAASSALYCWSCVPALVHMHAGDKSKHTLRSVVFQHSRACIVCLCRCALLYTACVLFNPADYAAVVPVGLHFMSQLEVHVVLTATHCCSACCKSVAARVLAVSTSSCDIVHSAGHLCPSSTTLVAIAYAYCHTTARHLLRAVLARWCCSVTQRMCFLCGRMCQSSCAFLYCA
eukprot:20317-Heterococcus_DN1.PRE.1